MQDPEQQKNLLIAVALSMAVLLAWQLFYAGPKMREEQARQRVQQEQLQTTTKPQSAPTAAEGGAKVPAVTPEGTVPGASPETAPTETREEAIKASPRLAIETPSLRGSINLKSGRIDDLVLVKYRETVDPNSPNVILLSPTNSPHPYFAEYGWLSQANSPQKMPDTDTLWTAEGTDPLTPTHPVTLTWDNGQGLIFKRTISVDPDYMFKIVDAVENHSGSNAELRPYARIHRYGTPKVQGYWILHEGLIGVANHNVDWCGSVLPSILCQLKYKAALEDGERSFESKAGWLGITDKYWAAALIPDQTVNFRAHFIGQKPARADEEPSYQTDYLRDAIAVPPGESRSIDSQLFAGAKEVKLLQRYESDNGIKQFDLLIDWGWFFFITKPLYYLMEAINSVVHNFGVTIIILTVLVRLAFFPLANKQFSSMAKMKKLQPQMEQLRERFKDDKARQQQELMELYKREKVNPIAGCVPVLLQLPVFFALYKVLFITIDMRHAPFFGWIKDLSAPDPTSLFNLFGLLPFAAPAFLHIGVWPLIMGITMWLQMQLNPQQPDPVQQQIFSWMPVVFTFLLASFPAGLVIYWAWSNTLSLTQQYVIMKRQGAEIHLVGNVARTFKPVVALTNHAMAALRPWLPWKGAPQDASPSAQQSDRDGSKAPSKSKDKSR
jgi:YidC/Oxa1 family membrane protein insertase